ncbi:type IV pilus biogenesis protein PilP [Pectobacterium versatile]|uniref:type IV pilus biogenesis protein PilP n=1 Tax=Pectobacterium versatile TaxID=2488639 RepID=UPI001F40C121|nr:type IV pilus biogenesis protein PilP [Pectobacterium versatile]
MVIRIFVLSSLMFSGLVSSETKTFSDLDVIQGETAYYQALTERNKAQAASQGFSSEFNVQGHNNDNTGGSRSKVDAATTALPVIEKIMGSNVTGVTAKLRFPDGSTSSVKVGDSVGSFKVISISIDSVKITSGDKTFNLRRSS